MSGYWRIFAEEVPSDMGIKLTDQQVDELTKALEFAYENYGMSHGHDQLIKIKPEKPTLNLSAPWNSGSTVSMLSGMIDDFWHITDRTTGHTFSFDGPEGRKKALEFYNTNRN